MAEQIHKKFTNDQVKDLMQRYIKSAIKRQHVQTILNIGKSRFFCLLKAYRQEPANFTIAYQRTKPTRSIDPGVDKNILKELKTTKQFIDNKDIPIRSYNYSFIRNDLARRYHQDVSLNTIISRAKEHGYYIPCSKKKAAHDREVITNNIGELIQHDSSLHLWSPYAKEKWWLITSSIFRFVRGRDELHYKHHKMTDEAIPQWKQVLEDCRVKVIHALSPQAKGKVERPYGWIQDHIVRICARENIKTIAPANQVLLREVHEYNFKRVHSTTDEIPYLRYQRAEKDNKVVFRKFSVPPPYKTAKDIFCFRFDRTVDAYRTVSIDNLRLKFNNAPLHERVNLRIYPDEKSGLSEIRFWYKNQLLDVQFVKTELLKLSTFKMLSVHF